MCNAFSTSTPLTKPAAKRILRGDVGQLLSFAKAVLFFASLSSVALFLFLDPIFSLFLN
jgi:hypothetical protein